MNTRCLILTVVTILVLTLGGCARPAPPAPATVTSTPSAMAVAAQAEPVGSSDRSPGPNVAASTDVPRPAIDLQPCTVGGFRAAKCGTLSVYENRAAAAGRKIDLRVTVIPASSPDPAPDPIFYLAGGPGAAANDAIGFARQLLGGLNERRDLVFVDQRGTGDSHKLVCQTGPVGMSADGDARAASELRACLAGLDGDPAAYTTAWGMDDLDDVRAALGYDRINLYGGSYGPTAAQVYILRHGEHARSAALTGASLLEAPMFEWMPRSSQHALETVFARCEADAACHEAYPNVRAEFAEIVARLDRGPIDLPVTDPGTGKPLQFTRSHLSLGLHNGLLMNTATHSQVPGLIHQMYTGDLAPIAATMNPPGGQDSKTDWQIMNLNILCNEDWAVLRQAETEQMSAGSYLRYADARAIVAPEAICAAMPRPPAAALYGALKPSPVPILFLTGEADPQDPESNVAAAKERFPNSRVLVAPGQAHNYTGLGCRAAIIQQFIESGSTEGLDVACLGREVLPSFSYGGM